MSAKKLTHYAVLGVPPDATYDEIQQAYRRKAHEFHPDRHSTSPPETVAHATNAMVEANEAWKVLGDPIGRKAYDSLLLKEKLRADAARRRAATYGTPKVLGAYLLLAFLILPLVFTLMDSSPVVRLIWGAAVLVGLAAAASIWLVIRDMNR